MNSKEWALWMARQIYPSLQTHVPLEEPALAGIFQGYIQQLLTEEHRQILNELTDMAFREKDPERRATYFKLARLVQARTPKPIEFDIPLPVHQVN